MPNRWSAFVITCSAPWNGGWTLSGTTSRSWWRANRRSSRGEPLPTVHHETRVPGRAQFPMDELRGALSADARAVNAEQMAPAAHGSDVARLVAAAGRAEHEMVRRDILRVAHRTATPIAIADINATVCHRSA